MWKEYINAASLEDVLKALDEHGAKARIIAGATDLILEIERGIRKNIDVIIDISRIKDLDAISLDDQGYIHLGPMVTHNQCVSSKLIREHAVPLALACWEVGSPQIRNRGTIVGNLVTASPANDTISPLVALDATLILKSLTRERSIPLRDFYTGVRKTLLQPDEMVIDVRFKAMKKNQIGSFKKMALRKSQAISIVNVTALASINDQKVEDISITLGSVAPTIIHAPEAESFLVGKELNEENIKKASELTQSAIKPISDIRGSSHYRKAITKVATKRALMDIKDETALAVPEHPVLLSNLDGDNCIAATERLSNGGSPIETTINGKHYQIKNGFQKTLLDLIREDVGLTGTKEGCAEGECGACTVIMDGMAVMSCMVPAERAHLANIVTVEGISTEEIIHPIQQAFIEEGAVQCGYCTPGFIMSAVKLLEEKPTPSQLEIKHAISGNLCRCTGYYKIISAIEKASKNG